MAETAKDLADYSLASEYYGKCLEVEQTLFRSDPAKVGTAEVG